MQIAVSQRPTAVVLKVLTNELFYCFSLHYVQMEESSTQVSTAIGWTVDFVCTVLVLLVSFLGGKIDFFSTVF